MENAPRTRLLTALMLVVVFGSGTVVGFALDTNLAAASPEMSESEEGAVTEARRVPMYEQVGPNEMQKESIDSIVRDHRESMKGLHREFREAYNPRYQALVQEARDAIKSVFDSEQAEAYDSLLAAHDRRRAEERERRDEEQD